MADITKTTEIIFQGVDRTKDVFSQLHRNLDTFSGKMESAARPLANFADDILALDTALAAMAAAGLAVSINQAGKFGDSFKEITTLIDDTGQGVDQFRNDILAYSRDSTKSIEDIESAIYTAISAGVDYKDALDLLDDSEKLSIATKSDLEGATKLLASTLNAYGESTDQATRYSDILFQTVKNGQTTFPELSSSLASVLNIAANAGVPFETLAAAIAAVTATGAPTSQAITSIQSALSNIIKPSTQATELAEELGIEFNATALKTEGFEKILWKVYDATGGSADKMAVLFGDVNGLSSAMTLGADASGKFRISLEAMANSAGATETAYKKMVDNFKDINQNLANNVQATFVQIGLKLLDNYKDIAESLSEVFKSVGTSIDAGTFDAVFKALNDFGGDIAKFFNELAGSLPEALASIKWDGFLKALGDLGDSIGSMFDDFDPSDPEAVRDAIQFVVDSIETLIRVTDGMVEGFKPFIQAILNSVDALNRMDTVDKETAGNVLALAKAITTLGTGLTTLMLAVGNNADDIKKAFEVVAGSIELGWGALKSGIQSIAWVVLETFDLILAGAEKVTFGDWNVKIRDARAGIQETLEGIEDRFFQSADNVHDGWARIVDAFSKGAVSLQDDWNAINSEMDAFNFDATIEPTLETRTLEENLAIVEQKMAKFKASNSKTEIVFTADRDPVEEFFSFLNDEFSNVYSLDFSGISDNLPNLEFKTTYKWTDANGGLHITDTPPNPGEAIGDIEEIKAPIKTEVDKDSLDKTTKKISEVLDASVGDFNVKVNVDGVGVGPQNQTLQEYFKDEVQGAKTDLGDLFDPSGMADLFDAMKDATDPHDIQLAERAIRQQLELQKQAFDAQTRLTNAQAAVAEDMVRAADIMWQTASVDDKTIKIEAAGVEPEIEAFMWKILKKIQVRANKAGAEFLLAAAD
ncbi:phage tail tape measure protein, TP901 family [delta proteobacterium NaphS2]|nr:phage tail tape measure protein, TP901 family [delta proteobacterium NaphS2]